MVSDNRDLLIRYLLGDLPEEKLERFTEHYFVHDDAWQALSAIESDLIDDYVRGRLSQASQQKFESHFMRFPERQERVEFARMLMNSAIREQISSYEIPHVPAAISGRQPTLTRHWIQSRAVGFLWAVATLSLLIIIAILMVQNGQLRKEMSSIQHARAELQESLAKAQREVSNRASDAGNARWPLAPVTSIILSPGVLRNNEGREPMLHLNTDLSSVDLLLSLDQDRFAEYAATITTAEGRLISQIRGLKSQSSQSGGRVVSLNVPSQLLKRNDYVVTLFGLQTDSQKKIVNSYVFSVLRP